MSLKDGTLHTADTLLALKCNQSSDAMSSATTAELPVDTFRLACWHMPGHGRRPAGQQATVFGMHSVRIH